MFLTTGKAFAVLSAEVAVTFFLYEFCKAGLGKSSVNHGLFEAAEHCYIVSYRRIEDENILLNDRHDIVECLNIDRREFLAVDRDASAVFAVAGCEEI